MLQQSHRWISSADLDVDAYFLTTKNWVLFVHARDPKKTTKSFLSKLVKTFPYGNVAALSGAIKLKTKTEPLETQCFLPSQASFLALENNFRYLLKINRVLNPGLFLDQANNRKELFQRIKNGLSTPHTPQKLLNLFSYTGSFSVVATGAGVQSTTSVDTSKNYLEWEKRNHTYNEISTKQTQHFYICEDTRIFLKKTIHRQEYFHWIIIDPPTFSRFCSKIFQVKKELPTLLEQARRCLFPKGTIFISTNDSQWKKEDFNKFLFNFSRKYHFSLKQGSHPTNFQKSHPLKSAWLELL